MRHDGRRHAQRRRARGARACSIHFRTISKDSQTQGSGYAYNSLHDLTRLPVAKGEDRGNEQSPYPLRAMCRCESYTGAASSSGHSRTATINVLRFVVVPLGLKKTGR